MDAKLAFFLGYALFHLMFGWLQLLHQKTADQGYLVLVTGTVCPWFGFVEISQQKGQTITATNEKKNRYENILFFEAVNLN